ncbi:hypothetical protein Clacol_003427 [Clathrus columnatus]|uniref:Uncharacterized protein n=1 Tax=Clathrus columnatus TaxID=1419009 RepID=A0AAV5AB99_9AGAM|nr:hypothetical protein Clacol_003427 [Clathrus columnatus]
MAKAARGNASPEVLDGLFCGYVAAVDNTAAILAEPLYRAYPDAKFILTTRDPAKWAQSIKKTILRVATESKAREDRITSGTATKMDRILFEKTTELGMLEWQDAYQQGYHQGRLHTDPEGELKRHNEHIMQLIPPEKLLVFNVSEGWEPLAKFLGVPVPDEPFPCLNDALTYEKRGNEWWEKLTKDLL